MHLRKNEAGFSLLEIMAVVAVILIIAALGIPQIMGMRGKAKNRSCDALYHELDSEIANALDNLIWSSTQVIQIVLGNHTEESNPRNKGQFAFVTSEAGIGGSQNLGAADAASCQVELRAGDALSLVIKQARLEGDESGAERSFRIGITDGG